MKNRRVADTATFVRGERGWGISQRVRVVICLLALGQSACMLVGYDGVQAMSQARTSDAGRSSEAGPLPGVQAEPTADSAVAGPSDAAGLGADGTADAEAGTASLADASPGGLFPAPNALADASATTQLPATDADAGGLGVSDAALPSCMGASALGLCWHLGAFGRSCNETCDMIYGGFDPRTILYTGEPREGGSLANCQVALLALGITAVPTASYRPDALGLGCHVWSTGATYWIDDRQTGPFDSGDSYFAARRVCACAY